MIVTMATERLESLEQVRAFVEGSDGLDFIGSDRPSRNDFVRRVLVKFGHGTLGKADKGLVKRFLGKATGLSRAQLTRLVRQRAETGRVEDRRGGAPAWPLACRSMAACRRSRVVAPWVCSSASLFRMERGRGHLRGAGGR